MRGVNINLREGRELSLGVAMKLLEEFAWGLMIHDICLGYGFDFAWGSIFLEYCLGLDRISLGLNHVRLGRPISTTVLLGVLLGVDLLGAVRQGCIPVTNILACFGYLTYDHVVFRS